MNYGTRDIEDAITLAHKAEEIILQDEQKMTVCEFNEIVKSIDTELCRFEYRWLDKLHLLNYSKAIKLLFSEIDRYPKIKQYNAGKLNEVVQGVLADYFSAMGVDGDSWGVIKLEMLMQLSPRLS